MSRPRKRPRLQVIGSISPEPDVELEALRRENDNVLKARWESIFERYGKDFTGVGDEIGNISGQIEIDNGHIRNMQGELDTGEESLEDSAFSGRHMLRAMTAAPSDYSGSVPDDEHVFQSIETIAGNVMLSEDSEDTFMRDQSEESDDLSPRPFMEARKSAQKASIWNPRTHGFAARGSRSRSSSPDSLFDVAEDPVQLAVTAGAKEPDLRAEVRKILQEEKEQALERAEEDIEPAWRLPVHISSMTTTVMTKTNPVSRLYPSRHTGDQRTELEGDLEGRRPGRKRKIVATAPQARSSLAGPSRDKRSLREVAAERNMRSIRADSEDPLQEGFSSEPERQRTARQRPRKSLADRTLQNGRSPRSSASRSPAPVPAHLDNSDAESVFSEDENFGPDSDVEIIESDDDRQGRDTRADRRLGVVPRYKRKSAGRKSTRTPLPRFSAPETDADKTTHPWQAPLTREGKPIDFRTVAQRKTLNAKFSVVSRGARDPVFERLERDRVLKPMEKGICAYCNNSHTNKHGVGSHWDRVLTNFVAETLGKNDPHDIEFIHSIRSRIERRVRPPVTRLLDFTTMVKMHEGQGKTFEDIIKSNLLFTTKSAAQLEKEFRIYRQRPEDRQSEYQWTEEQLAHLKELMKKSPDSTRHSFTLIRIHRLVGAKAKMEFADIGNKIADLIMESGDYSIHLPLRSSITNDRDSAESAHEDNEPAVKDEDQSLIDPAILNSEPVHLNETDSADNAPMSEDIAEQPQQALVLPNNTGLPTLYHQLASYANEQNMLPAQSFAAPSSEPIDMASRC